MQIRAALNGYDAGGRKVAPAVPVPAEEPEPARVPCTDDCWMAEENLPHHHEDWGAQGIVGVDDPPAETPGEVLDA